MRIVQIIDSLYAGGAERMAVNYANSLSEKIEFSGLVVSRMEGPLLNQIDKKVSYLFLKRRSILDLKALFTLRKFVVANKIEIIHAHSTSYFMAFLLKLAYPKISVIWHNHYGASEFLSKNAIRSLKVILPFFDGIIAVNHQLKLWAKDKLRFKNVTYLPNFPSKGFEILEKTDLEGSVGKRILSLANLREEKDHFFLLEIAKKVKISHPDWSFHLVGKDFEDEYSAKIKQLIVDFNLEKNVFIYGSRQDVGNIIEQSTITILTSQWEGLPVALLEYGQYKKPVVITNVGEIPLIIKDGENGFIVKSGDSQQFYNSLVSLIDNESLQRNFGIELHHTILKQFSEHNVIEQYLSWLEKK